MNHKNNSTKTDWEQKRSLEREKMRKERERSDWIFERAKHRKDIRYEETRGDWYFDRKHQRNIESDNTKSKQKGEKLQPTSFTQNCQYINITMGLFKVLNLTMSTDNW